MSQPDRGPDAADAPATIRNARNGLRLFAVYGLLYLAFMLLTAFAPAVLNEAYLGGINLSIVYGLGLIAAALLLALVYAWLCRPRPPEGRP